MGDISEIDPRSLRRLAVVGEGIGLAKTVKRGSFFQHFRPFTGPPVLNTLTIPNLVDILGGDRSHGSISARSHLDNWPHSMHTSNVGERM
jgi:hypothetical protein